MSIVQLFHFFKKRNKSQSFIDWLVFPPLHRLPENMIHSFSLLGNFVVAPSRVSSVCMCDPLTLDLST